MLGLFVVDVLVGAAISRPAAVFYNTATVWTELEMLPKRVQLCFFLLLYMAYYFRIRRVNIIF